VTAREPEVCEQEQAVVETLNELEPSPPVQPPKVTSKIAKLELVDDPAPEPLNEDEYNIKIEKPAVGRRGWMLIWSLWKGYLCTCLDLMWRGSGLWSSPRNLNIFMKLVLFPMRSEKQKGRKNSWPLDCWLRLSELPIPSLRCATLGSVSVQDRSSLRTSFLINALKIRSRSSATLVCAQFGLPNKNRMPNPEEAWFEIRPGRKRTSDTPGGAFGVSTNTRFAINFGPERGLFRGRVQYSADSFQFTRACESKEQAEQLCEQLNAAQKKNAGSA
jgi:hypothetical protein